MSDRTLNRRQLLAAIGTAGGVGASFGAVSGAVLNDSASFPSNGILAGGLDLHVTTASGSSEDGTARIDVTISDEERSGSEIIELSAPEEFNPLYAWVATTCLEEHRLAESLSLSLSYVDCDDGTVGQTVADGSSFYEFASLLASGLPLDGDPETEHRDCLTPGSTLCLELSWSLAEDYVGSVDGGFSLEFLGRQCRHNDGTTNPFEERVCDDGGRDISWLAFCAEDGATLSEAELEFDVEDDVLTLHSAPQVLDEVLLKYDTELRIFDSPGESGTFRTTSGGQTYQQDGSSFPGTEEDRSIQTPCPDTCGLKYEMDAGTSELESTEGCSQ